MTPDGAPLTGDGVSVARNGARLASKDTPLARKANGRRPQCNALLILKVPEDATHAFLQ